jgi:hypothetical protein
MSRTTENLHVRGVRVARVIGAIERYLATQGYERVPDTERARAERTVPDLLRIGLRRERRWTTIADERGFGGFGQHADGDLEGWGRALSRELDRSVLAIWTWDGESAVTATRWKRGKRRGSLELLRDATRGADGKPRAPAKVLWPWLPKKERDGILRDGIALVEKSTSTSTSTSTGDAALDALLEDFDDVDDESESESEDADEDGDDDVVYVPLETSVGAIGRAIGIEEPILDPCDERDGDAQLLFRPTPRRA